MRARKGLLKCQSLAAEKKPPPVDVYGLWAPMPREDFSLVVRGALQQMFERKMAVEQPVKAKIIVQVRIKMCEGWLLS